MSKLAIPYTLSDNVDILFDSIIEMLNEFKNSADNKFEENLIENIKNQFRQL